MNLFDKIIFTSIEAVAFLFGISNLIEIGADYRHLMAAMVGSLLATTRMKLSRTEKVINSLGGFSTSSFVTPALCDHYSIEPHSATGILSFFIVGFAGMLFLTMIVDFLNTTKGQIPAIVLAASAAAIAWLKKWMNIENKKP